MLNPRGRLWRRAMQTVAMILAIGVVMMVAIAALDQPQG